MGRNRAAFVRATMEDPHERGGSPREAPAHPLCSPTFSPCLPGGGGAGPWKDQGRGGPGWSPVPASQRGARRGRRMLLGFIRFPEVETEARSSPFLGPWPCLMTSIKNHGLKGVSAPWDLLSCWELRYSKYSRKPAGRMRRASFPGRDKSFSVVPDHRASSNGQKLQVGRFRLDIRQKCFTGRKTWRLCSH